MMGVTLKLLYPLRSFVPVYAHCEGGRLERCRLSHDPWHPLGLEDVGSTEPQGHRATESRSA